jgi:signal peptidase II
LKKSLIIIFLILVADQALKFWIKMNMTIGQEFHVFDNWFLIHFTENEGMAFGLSFGGEFGKLALSLFRIVAIVAIGWYLNDLIKKKAGTGVVLSISLILAGAIGNILDSAFYGMIFSFSSYHTVAQLFPEAGGYGTFLHGKVVDMLYFPLIEGHYPDWIPFWGGNDFIFFRPVFNIADSSITVGVFLLILFQRKFFARPIGEEALSDDDSLMEDMLYQEEQTESTNDAVLEDIDTEEPQTDSTGKQSI